MSALNSQPAMLMFTGDIEKDVELQACTLATKGFWWAMLRAMHSTKSTGLLEGTIEDFAKWARCTEQEALDCLANLQEKGAANVAGNVSVTQNERLCNEKIILINRKMRREHLRRMAAKERAKRSRLKSVSRSCNANVAFEDEDVDLSSLNTDHVAAPKPPPETPLSTGVFANLWAAATATTPFTLDATEIRTAQQNCNGTALALNCDPLALADRAIAAFKGICDASIKKHKAPVPFKIAAFNRHYELVAADLAKTPTTKRQSIYDEEKPNAEVVSDARREPQRGVGDSAKRSAALERSGVRDFSDGQRVQRCQADREPEPYLFMGGGYGRGDEGGSSQTNHGSAAAAFTRGRN